MTRSQREHRQRQMLILFTGIAAVVVVLALAIGAFYQYFWFPRESFASVNGMDIRRSDYVKVRTYELLQEGSRISQQITLAQSDQQPQMQARLTEIQTELQDLSDGDADPDGETIATMIDDRLVLFNMESLGVSISDDELDEFILGLFSPVPLTEPTTTPTVEPTAAAWATATTEAFTAQSTQTAEAQATVAEQTAEAVPTDDPNATPAAELTPDANETPDAAETPEAGATAEASGTPDADGDSTPEAGGTATVDPNATPTATAEPTQTPNAEQAVATSEASFDLLDRNFLDQADMSRGDFERLIARPALARQRVQEVLATDVPSRADQAHLGHILVATQEAAQELIDTRLKDEEFEDVAREVSVDTQSAQNGGDLGWAPPSTFVDAFSEAAFALEPGEISAPVQTQFGWHIIKMYEREDDRPLTIQALNQAKSAAFQDWLDGLRESADIESDVTLPSGDQAPASIQ